MNKEEVVEGRQAFLLASASKIQSDCQFINFTQIIILAVDTKKSQQSLLIITRS